MENWETFTEFDKTHYVDTEYAVEGTGSLRVESVDGNTEATIYQPSLETANNDAATEGRIETTVRRTEDVYLGIYVRFVDIENHYFVAGGSFEDPDGVHNELRLYRTEGGETEFINAVEFDTFSDRTDIGDFEPRWIPFRITWFSDAMDRFRIWVQEDAKEDGEWDDVGGTLVDSSPAFGPNETTTGSGVGFGGNTLENPYTYGLYSEDGLWYDQTNLYYDTNAE